MDKGAWQATVHKVTESDTTEQLTHSLSLHIYLYGDIFKLNICIYTVIL